MLANTGYVELILSDTYTHRTYYMGTVDEQQPRQLLRRHDPRGGPRRQGIRASTIRATTRQHIAEHVEPWTYLKFPYLKSIGWKGFVDGKESGVYCATPLSRLNAADGMATPQAQAAYEKMYDTLGSKKLDGRYQPVHHRLATHWARLVELLYAAERMVELVTDPGDHRPQRAGTRHGTPDEGVGCVEAPRGTLTHHYGTDERGMLTKVNLIVGTTNNYAPIAMSIKKAAQTLIKKGTVVTEGLLNRIEMAFRRLRPVLRLRHPRAARPDAARGGHSRRARPGCATPAPQCGR